MNSITMNHNTIVYVVCLVFFLSVAVQASDDVITLSFDKIEITSLIDLVYGNIIPSNYLINQEVLAKSQFVTVRLKPGFKRSQLHDFMKSLLVDYGITIDDKNGYYHFRQGSSLIPQQDTFVYRPRYRSVEYLVSLLQSSFSGIQLNQTPTKVTSASLGVSSPGAVGTSSVDNKDSMESSLLKLGKKSAQFSGGLDTLVFVGTQLEIEKFKILVEQLDIPSRQVHVRAWVYEFAQSDNDSSAFHVVWNLLKAKFRFSLGAVRGAGQTFIVDTDDIDAVFNVFSNDNRFRVLSSPSVFVRSGDAARFNVGTETPVLSGIMNSTPGVQPVQQVEYRQSGVTFEVLPLVRDESIDLTVHQQLSNFVSTTTGVSNSPTLLKRELNTVFTLKPNEIVVLAGLRENKLTRDRTYLPFIRYEVGSENISSSSEVVLFLYCQIVTDNQMITSIQFPDKVNDFIIQLPGAVSQSFVDSFGEKN